MIGLFTEDNITINKIIYLAQNIFDKFNCNFSGRTKWTEVNKELTVFFRKLDKYPFYEDLHPKEDPLPEEVLRQVLGESGLDYGNKPKGLLKFHKYSSKDRRTAFEEHVREAVKYCAGRQRTVRIHLTVSPQHLDGFQTEAARILPAIETETGMSVDLSFSFQKPETDTLAVDLEDKAFRPYLSY